MIEADVQDVSSAIAIRAGMTMEAVDAEDPLAKLVGAIIRKRRGQPQASTRGGHGHWTADFFGLQRVSGFMESTEAVQAAVLERCGRGLLEEALFIEKSGVAFAAKMILLAQSTDERKLYAMFAADEAAHLDGISRFCTADASAASDNPFLVLLSELIEGADRSTLQLIVQVVLEGWGLSHYRALRDGCTHAPLREVLASILADEAAHHASGVILLDGRALEGDAEAQIYAAMARFPVAGPVRSPGRARRARGRARSAEQGFPSAHSRRARRASAQRCALRAFARPSPQNRRRSTHHRATRSQRLLPSPCNIGAGMTSPFSCAPTIVDDKKTYARLQINHKRNKQQDHTALLDEAAAAFNYQQCKDEFWNPESHSLCHGTPIWEQASATQRVLLNQLYWVAYYSQIISAEIATIFFNQTSAAGLYALEDFRLICDTLDLESAQERAHIAAFKKISDAVEHALFGERVFSWSMRGPYEETMVHSDAGPFRRRWKQLQLRTYGMLSSGNAFIACQYFTIRALRTLNGKIVQHQLAQYYANHADQANAPVPSAISHYHFQDESYHFNSSMLIAQDVLRSLAPADPVRASRGESGATRLPTRSFPLQCRDQWHLLVRSVAVSIRVSGASLAPLRA